MKNDKILFYFLVITPFTLRMEFWQKESQLWKQHSLKKKILFDNKNSCKNVLKYIVLM